MNSEIPLDDLIRATHFNRRAEPRDHANTPNHATQPSHATTQTRATAPFRAKPTHAKPRRTTPPRRSKLNDKLSVATFKGSELAAAIEVESERQFEAASGIESDEATKIQSRFPGC
jgi:hypothetical protein